MKTILISVLVVLTKMLSAQSPFQMEVLSPAQDVIKVSYDGSLGSVADHDTVKLKPFQFLSIGKLKKVSAVGRGSVYAVFTFSKNQIVVVESSGSDTSISSQWAPIAYVELMPYYPILNNPLKGSDRSSFSIQMKDYKVHILNIKNREVELFKWMASTINFI